LAQMLATADHKSPDNTSRQFVPRGPDLTLRSARLHIIWADYTLSIGNV
jgi:hypothetical protein